MSKIYLDAGHGGHDSGAVGKRSKEKDNVLKVAKQLKLLLEKRGHQVKMSRTKDVFVSLSQRASLANAWGADVFISLHNNSARASATGFETYIYKGKVSAKTKELQKAIHDAISKKVGLVDRGKKSANFAVLRLTKMPAVLIEYAFISNVNDERILINQVDNLAKWTCDGIVSFVGGKPVTSKPSGSTSKPASNSKKRPLKWIGTNDKGKRVESIYRGKEGLNFYDSPRWINPTGQFKYGEGWKIDNKYLVNGLPMYRVQNSKGKLYWITANSNYVTVKGKY